VQGRRKTFICMLANKFLIVLSPRGKTNMSDENTSARSGEVGFYPVSKHVPNYYLTLFIISLTMHVPILQRRR
jgi:hypothetical protein